MTKKGKFMTKLVKNIFLNNLFIYFYFNSGSYGDDFNNEEFDAAYAYFRTLYKKIE